MAKRITIRMIMALVIFTSTLCIAVPKSEAGGITVFKDGPKYVKMGGRIQLQYHNVDKDGGATNDTLAFRRFRPFIEGSLHENWKGKFQFDLGKAKKDNEIAIKDAYFQYKGFKGVHVTIGNANFAFSRELLSSSKYQQLVERTFVGDHNYGTPDRNLGIHLAGEASGGQITWRASVASAMIDPDTSKLDFDTPVNKNTDFNEGWMFGGRVEFHPFGKVKFSQGELSRTSALKASIGAAAFAWNNDGDNNTTPPTGKDDKNVESVTGYEISGAVRVAGLSVDAQYNLFNADTVDTTITSGIYKNGATDLTNYSIEGGYTILPNKLEVVAGYQVQDADNYGTEWNRTSLGANWFLNKHDVKVQATYRLGTDIKGVSGTDEDEVFIQAQYVF